jgi:hypothetical protein
MKSVCVALLAIVVFGAAVSPARAQKRPDFTGTWEEDASQRKSPFENTAATGGARAIARPAEPLRLTQTADRLTLELTFMDQVTRMSYDFDGRENVNRTGAQIHTTRSRWEGAKFITEGSIFQMTSQGEESWTLKASYWMTPKGEMVQERTQVDEDGKTNTVYRVFRKK